MAAFLKSLAASNGSQDQSGGVVDESPEAAVFAQSRRNDATNVVLITRLVLRRLLEHCMCSDTLTTGRLMSSDQQELVDLLVMLEKVLKNGFKPYYRTTLQTVVASPEAQRGALIERVSRRDATMAECVKCVQQLPHVTSSLGRLRAFLRLAVMQKRLADYFQVFHDNRQMLQLVLFVEV